MYGEGHGVPPRRAKWSAQSRARGGASGSTTTTRRAQLLELARKAFSDRSYDEVSIDDLAREAKISKGLLYHYFPTKRDLYVAGLREIARRARRSATSRDPDGPRRRPSACAPASTRISITSRSTRARSSR